MTDKSEDIIKAARLDLNLCLFLAILNGLPTVEQQEKFNGGSLANPGQAFLQYCNSPECLLKYGSSKESAAARFEKDGFNEDDICRWCDHLVLQGRIIGYSLKTIEANSFNPAAVFYQNETFVLMGWCTKDVAWTTYYNALKKAGMEKANSTSAYIERKQAEVYRDRGSKQEYIFRDSTHGVSIAPFDPSMMSDEESASWNTRNRVRMPLGPAGEPSHHIYDNGLNKRRAFTIANLAEQISFPFKVFKFKVIV